MTAWHSPGSIFHVGHAALKSLFTAPVQVQEKVDGSTRGSGVVQGEITTAGVRRTTGVVSSFIHVVEFLCGNLIMLGF